MPTSANNFHFRPKKKVIIQVAHLSSVYGPNVKITLKKKSGQFTDQVGHGYFVPNRQWSDFATSRFLWMGQPFGRFRFC
ncbi:hypothetical protein PJP10_32155, partial [Mycobacterium kansasii]